jgi:mRNA-degrading endonuclease YafQ of YafQ-DinJ toxin-antitoxin module
MSYTVKVTSQFKKSYKLAVKRGLDVTLLTLVDTGTHSDLFRK